MYKEFEVYGEYEVEIEDDFTIRIKDTSAPHGSEYAGTVSVKLASQDEANKAIEELSDESGDKMCEPDSVFTKYSELQRFKP